VYVCRQDYVLTRAYRDLNAVVAAAIRPKELVIVKSGCLWY
jgi:hypothetical protein